MKYKIFLITSLLFIGFIWSQEFQLTSHIDVRHGGGVMENLDTNVVVIAKSASIIIGAPATGYAAGGQYNTDFGFYSFYLKEPDAPSVHATKGTFPNKVRMTWVQDPLSPPAYHSENYDASDIFYIFKDDVFYTTQGPIDETDPLVSTKDGVLYDYEVTPGVNYSYALKAKNKFGESSPTDPYGPLGSDVGLVSPNGTVSGIITTPNSAPVPGLKVKVSPNIGKSIRLAQNGYAKIQDSNKLDPDTTFTVELWFKPTEGSGVLINKSNSDLAVNKGQYQLSLVDEYLTFKVWGNDNTSHSVTSSQISEIGAWNYAAVRFDNGNINLVLNESVITDIYNSAQVFQGNYPGDDVLIGTDNTETSINSRFDEIRIWNIARPLNEIITNYDISLNGDEEGLVAYFQCNEGFGEDVYDRTANEVLLSFYDDVQWSDYNSPAANAGITNSYGSYTISGIYYGDGLNYNIIPEGEYHEFYPVQRTVTLSPNNTIVDEVDFTDIAILQVSGNAFFKGSDCAVVGASVLHGSDSLGWTYFNPPVYTDEEGKFEMEFSPTTTDNIRIAMGLELTEPFEDTNFNAKYDPAEEYTDVDNELDCDDDELFIDLNYNGEFDEVEEPWEDLNGIPDYQAPEDFNDYNGNGVWDDAEFYWDINNNGQFDDGESYIDAITNPTYNGVYDEGEDFTDVDGDEEHTEGEPFIDGPSGYETNGVWDAAEIFEDENGNGVYDLNDTFVDENGDGLWDAAEPSTDLNGNGQCDVGELFSDWNGNGIRDVAQYDFKYGNSQSTYAIDNILEPIVIGWRFEADVSANLSGKVKGGSCDADIGESLINIIPLNSCIDPFSISTENGEFNTDLFPLQYYVSISREGDFLDPDISGYLSEKYGTIAIDLSDSTVLNYTYRSPIQLRSSDLPLYDTENLCAEGADDGGVEYPYCTKNDHFFLDLEVFEEYDNFVDDIISECKADTGTITIYDDIRGQFNSPYSLAYSNGKTRYFSVGGLPNLSPAGEHPFQRQIYMIAEDQNGQTVNLQKWAYILGERYNPSEFISSSPQIPLFILRDPPGDQSYSYLTQGNSYCNSIGFSVEGSLEGEVFSTVSLAPDFEVSLFGFSVATDGTFDINASMSAGFSTSASGESQMCLDLTETYATQNDGDVFVGGSIAILYGVADRVLIGPTINNADPNNWVVDSTVCVPNKQTDVFFNPNGISSTYIFSEGHLNREVIPELKEIIANPSTIDSVKAISEASLLQWNNLLVYNDSLKSIATLIDNKTLASGASYEYSTTTTSTDSYTFETHVFINAEVGINTGLNVNGLGVTGGFNVSTGIDIGGSTSSESSNSMTVGAYFADDDLGDEYQFAIKKDNVNGTLVFDIDGGKSSCPWTYGTSPRDGLELSINPPNQPNLLPDTSGIFNLSVSNISNTGEDRWYSVSLVETSNPDGLSIGGLPGSEFEVEIDSMASFTVTVDQGPESLAYEDIRFLAYPACEYNDLILGSDGNYNASIESDTLSIFDEALLDISWAPACTDVEFLSLTDGWFVNQDDSLFNIGINVLESNQGILDLIECKYRPLGGGDNAWVEIFTVEKDSLNDNGTYAGQWDVSNSDMLPDGEYEFRLISSCLDGNMKTPSSIIQGGIDRESPGILSYTPIPVQGIGVLTPTNEISITFDEEINCEALNATVNFKLLDTSSGDYIAINYSCSDKYIAIEPDIQNAFIENHILKITLSGIKDLAGNIVVENEEADLADQYSAQWQFFVNRNPIGWGGAATLDLVTYVGETYSFNETLNNLQSQPGIFEFGEDNPVPEWLTISPMYGEINPGGSVEINMNISEYINYGEEYYTLFAETVLGDEPLNLNIQTICRPPDWAEIDKNELAEFYGSHMDAFAQVLVVDVISDDIFDKVVATINGDVRGHASLEYNDALQKFMLDDLKIYGNQDDLNKEIEFKIWDNNNCRELWDVEPIIAFDDNYTPLYDDPWQINAVTLATAQNIGLNSGWTWLSLNLTSGDMSLDAITEDLDSSPGDLISSQSNFSQYYEEGDDWVGLLDTLNTQSMYQTFMANDMDLTIVGLEVVADSNVIAYSEGWNWIAYSHQSILDIGTAFMNMNIENYDIVKGQYGFAQYAAEIGWIGSLTHLNPGEGYMLNAGSGGSFIYPNDVPGMARSIAMGNQERANIQELYSTAGLNPHEYEHSMSIISDMSASASFFSEHNLEDLSFIAYVDDDIRGISKLETYIEIDKDLLFLSVYGNQPGEKVYIRVYDEVTEEEFLTSLEFGFNKNDIIGSINSPVTLSGIIPVIPEAYKLSQNYPNPFNPSTRIDFQTPEDGQVDISIYNIRGQEVITLKSEFMQAGYGSLIWNGTDHSGVMLPTGIYFVKMEAVNYRTTRKMMLLK